MNFIKEKFLLASLALLCALVGVLSVAGCAKSDSAREKIFAPADAKFPMKIGEKKFLARLAISDSEKARGLMFVKSLPQDEAMIFVNETPAKASYWMKNTFIPLDLAFFDSNGVLIEVKSLFPHDENSVKSSRADVKYCMEANAGWFSKNNLKSSNKLDMELLKRAIKARKGK